MTYIDSIIICSKFKNDWEILHVVYRQTHRHSYNCRRKSENICRLYNPHHQWDVLRFLIHLMKTHLQFLKKTANNCGKQLKKKPNGFKEGKDITFDELIKKFDVSGHQYILAIRSSLNTPTIFLRINNYNPSCLRAWWENVQCLLYHIFSKAKKEWVSEQIEQYAVRGNDINEIGHQFTLEIGFW